MAFSLGLAGSATAQVSVSVRISAPPPIVFSEPPEVVVLPETTGVYVVPDAEQDMYFWNGSWWRPWEGRWYRSANYGRGWAYYRGIPQFYYDVDPQWRRHYADHSWYGHPWEYRRIPHRDLEHNWRQWHTNRHWEQHGAWGVQGYQPRPRQEWDRVRAERREHYVNSPEVRRHRQDMGERHDPGRQEPRHVAPERQRLDGPDRRPARPVYQQPAPQPQRQVEPDVRRHPPGPERSRPDGRPATRQGDPHQRGQRPER
jgi:hypothetical protein